MPAIGIDTVLVAKNPARNARRSFKSSFGTLCKRADHPVGCELDRCFHLPKHLLLKNPFDRVVGWLRVVVGVEEEGGAFALAEL